VTHLMGSGSEEDDHPLGSALETPNCSNKRNNAGEIYVRLRLVKDTGRLNSILALALDPLPPQNHGTYKVEDGVPKLDIQDLWDDMLDLKRRAFDDGCLSVKYFISYLLRWRSVLLSALTTMATITVCLHEPLIFPMIPGFLAFLMMVLACASLRQDMTTGGSNAPMSESGFLRVAKWCDTCHMVNFVSRVATDELNGAIVDSQELELLSASLWDGGRPTCTFPELKDALLASNWCTFTPITFDKGTLVLIDERRRAVIRGPKQASFLIDYEEPPLPIKSQEVARSRLQLRGVLPAIPPWVIPASVEAWLFEIHEMVDGWKLCLVPFVDSMAGVLTWRRRCKSLTITLCLVFLCVFAAYPFFAGEDTESTVAT